nr:amidohydrolase [Aspergillus sp.]
MKVDTHQHALPSLIQDAIQANPAPSMGLKFPEWTPQMALSFMDHNNIQTTILSCAIPLTSIHPSPSDAPKVAALTRQLNDYLADLRTQHPSRLGFFAALPSLEDTPACLAEIKYAFETLHADGVALFTSYNNKYLGHPSFAPIWAELNKYSAVVFTHPSMENPEKAIAEPFPIPRPFLDWSHETTRTAVHLILTDTLERVAPRCRVILSHGGGTLPFVAKRIATSGIEMIPVPIRNSDADAGTGTGSGNGNGTSTSMGRLGMSADEFLQGASRFYYDTALMVDPAAFKLLVEFVPRGHLVYGTDYPFVGEGDIHQRWDIVEAEGGSRALEMGETALELFPRLGSV